MSSSALRIENEYFLLFSFLIMSHEARLYKLLICKGLMRKEETNAKIKLQDVRKQDMTIDIAFTFWKIVFERKHRSRKEFHKGKVRETVTIVRMVTNCKFNSEVMIPCCYSSTSRKTKCLQWMLIWTNTVKIIAHARWNWITLVGKRL